MHVYCFMNARGDELVVSRRCAVIISATAGLCAPRIQNPRGDKWPAPTDETRRKQFARLEIRGDFAHRAV